MLGTFNPNFHSSFTFQSHRLRVFVGAAVTDASKAVDSRSLYEVLRIKRGTSQIEIKTAYRTLAKLYHPDATSRFMDSSIAMNGRDFMEIHDAYATLSDPDARAVYDYNLNVDVHSRWNAGSRSPGREGLIRLVGGRRISAGDISTMLIIVNYIQLLRKKNFVDLLSVLMREN